MKQLFREPEHFIYKKPYKDGCFYIRSMQNKDLALIHSWVNKPYARRFWQMQGTLNELTKHYNKLKEENRINTFILCNEVKPVALFEVYQVLSSELALKYEAEVSDYGIHLLMAPHKDLLYLKKNINKVSKECLKTIVDMLFTFNSVKRIFAEPDKANFPAHRLAESVGFSFIKDIQLMEKQAKLYMLCKKEYLNRNLLN